MKSSLKIGIAVLVVAIVAVAGASVFSMQRATNIVSPQMSTIPTPNTTPSPSSTEQPTQATATPSVPTHATATPSTPTVTISYHVYKAACGHWATEINITNQGYPSFSTDPTKFFVTAAGVDYSGRVLVAGMWDTINISNQRTYQGTLFYDAPLNVTVASLTYNDTSYNIVYEFK